MKLNFKIFLIFISYIFISLSLNSCSFLSNTTTLELYKDSNSKNIIQISRYHYGSPNWSNLRANIISDSINNNCMFAIATKFPSPCFTFGPPLLPIIPNFYYFGYKLFTKKDYNFFVDFAFKSIKNPNIIDLSQIKFYQLDNTTEIEIDTIKYIPVNNFGILESDIARTNYHDAKPIINSIITNKIITIDTLSYIRFNLKLSTYNLDEGLIIKFGDSFISNDSIKVSDIILIRKDRIHFDPIILGS